MTLKAFLLVYNGDTILSAVRDDNGKLAAVRLGTKVDKLTYASCVRMGGAIYFIADWTPLTDLKGTIIKSGLIILECFCPEHNTQGLQGYELTVYSEEFAFQSLSFDNFCKIVAQDIKSGIRRFANLDYEALLKEVRRGGLHDANCKLIFESGAEHILADRSLYAQPLDALATYTDFPMTIEWIYMSKGRADYTDWCALTKRFDTKGDLIWIPTSFLFPRVSLFHYEGESVIFPNKVINWGCLVHGDAKYPDFNRCSFPEFVLGDTTVELFSVRLPETVVIPYSSGNNTILSVYQCTGVKKCVIKDVTPNASVGSDTARVRLRVRSNPEMEVLVVECNLNDDIELDLSCSEVFRYVYLIDSTGEVCDTRSQRLHLSLMNYINTPVTVFASPRIYDYLVKSHVDCVAMRLVKHT